MKDLRVTTTARLFVLLVALSAAGAGAQNASSTIGEADRVLEDALSGSSTETRQLLDRAHCVHVVPSAGGKYRASGPLVCRSGGQLRGHWGPPAMMNLSAGDLSEYDSSMSIVVLMLSVNHIDAIIAGRDHTPTNAPGPEGQDDPPSASDYENVDTVSYTVTAGELRGVGIAGTRFGVDSQTNEELYGVGFELENIVRGEGVEVPAIARRLVEMLQSASPAMR